MGSFDFFLVSSFWPTRGRIGRAIGVPSQLVFVCRSGDNGNLDSLFRAPHVYAAAQLFTLCQHRAGNQYTGRPIKSSRLLRVSSSSQTILERESSIQVLTELKDAWAQWSYGNWYFQVDKFQGTSIICSLVTLDAILGDWMFSNSCGTSYFENNKLGCHPIGS